MVGSNHPYSHKPAEEHQDVYQAASQAVRDVDDEWPEFAKRKPSKRLIRIIIVLLVLIVAGAGYWAFSNHKSKPAAKTSSSQQSQNMPAPAGTSSNTTQTYTASGSDLNLSFSYPSDWTATPISGTDTKDQPITVTSPLVSLTDANGQTVTGKVVVQIRPGSANISELSNNNPTSALDATQIAYAAPTASQFQYAYLTFIHFSTGQKAAGAFEEVIITGQQSFTKGEAVSSVSADPVISASFYSCNSDACTGSGAALLSINNSTWQDNSTAKKAQNLFASLKLN